MAVSKKGKIREIYEALPKRNCGLCGYGNCGQFARAVAEGRASPFGCRQNSWAGYKVSKIIGVKVPTFSYKYAFYQPLFAQKSVPRSSPASLRKEVRGLSQGIDDILARIRKLEGKQESK